MHTRFCRNKSPTQRITKLEILCSNWSTTFGLYRSCWKNTEKKEFVRACVVSGYVCACVVSGCVCLCGCVCVRTYICMCCCTCLYLWMKHVCALCVFAHTLVSACVCVFVCVCVHVCLCVYLCMLVLAYTCAAYACTLWLLVHVCVCLHACVYGCVYYPFFSHYAFKLGPESTVTL